MEIIESDWQRISSIREEYLRLVEFADVHNVRNLCSWDQFRDSMIKIVGDSVPIEYRDYDVTISAEGEIKESYNGSVHTPSPLE